MAKTITIAAIKGGTGKTTTTGALAHAAAADGQKVLLIDLDPQCNLSIWHRANFRTPGSYDVIAKGTPVSEAIQSAGIPGIDIMCGSANLTAITTAPGSARRLQKALAFIMPAYDLILADTAPGMSETLNNALYVSDGIIIPLEADSASLQGYYQLMDIIKHIQQTQSTQLPEVLGIVITKYDSRPKINRLMYDTIAKQAETDSVPFLGTVRQGVAIRETMALQDNLYIYAPTSKPAQDYLTIYNTITIKRGNGRRRN